MLHPFWRSNRLSKSSINSQQGMQATLGARSRPAPSLRASQRASRAVVAMAVPAKYDIAVKGVDGALADCEWSLAAAAATVCAGGRLCCTVLA